MAVKSIFMIIAVLLGELLMILVMLALALLFVISLPLVWVDDYCTKKRTETQLEQSKQNS